MYYTCIHSYYTLCTLLFSCVWALLHSPTLFRPRHRIIDLVRSVCNVWKRVVWRDPRFEEVAVLPLTLWHGVHCTIFVIKMISEAERPGGLSLCKSSTLRSNTRKDPPIELQMHLIGFLNWMPYLRLKSRQISISLCRGYVVLTTILAKCREMRQRQYFIQGELLSCNGKVNVPEGDEDLPKL